MNIFLNIRQIICAQKYLWCNKRVFGKWKRVYEIGKKRGGKRFEGFEGFERFEGFEGFGKFRGFGRFNKFEE